MKLLLPLLLILSSVSHGADTPNADKAFFTATSQSVNDSQPKIINGLFLTGSTHTEHSRDMRTTSVNFQLFDSIDYVGSIVRFKEVVAPAEWQLITAYPLQKLWASATRKEIVHFGRGPENHVVLFEGPGHSSAAMVSGRLIYDDTTDTYSSRGITFRYEFEGNPVVDVMSGFVRPTKERGTYEMVWAFQDGTHNSADSLFAAKLTGILQTRRVPFYSVSPSKLVTQMTYQLSGENLSTLQAINFVKWWSACAAPLRHE